MSKQTTENTKNKPGLDVRHAPDPSVDPSEYCFDRDMILMLMNEPFLGTFGVSVAKVEDWKCSTAYVTVNVRTYQITMGYNPDFMRKLTASQRRGVFKHEYYHGIFMHVTDRSMAESRFHALWNVATDLAIDSIICGQDKSLWEKYLPDFCLLPGRKPKFCEDPKLAALIESFPPLKSADWYMEQLTQFAEENGNKDGEGNYTIAIGEDGNGESLDGHVNWGDIPDEVRDIIREKINEAVDNGIKAVQNKSSWGSVPAEIQGMIEAMRKHEVDWRAVVKMFAGRCRSMERDATIKKLNKRCAGFPGVKRQTVARLLWAVDQSGSMSDENVQMGLAEGFACSYEADMDIVNFDTEIDPSSFRTVKRGQGFQWRRTRCGGTDFNCVQRFVNSAKNRGRWTGVVLMTDGYAGGLGRVVGARVLWLITPDGTMDTVRTGDLVVKMKEKKGVKVKK